MTILFPSSPLRPAQPEPDFEPQFEAARDAGLGALLLDFDALESGRISRALRLARASDELQVLVYRGWMLRPELYADLCDALRERNYSPINDPKPYALCHELPNWYPILKGRTPRSTWLPIPDCFDSQRVLEAAASFGSGALIVKDYVKSRKHEWADSCFIPDAGDAAEVSRVTQNFLSRQAENLAGGLVLRQFAPLRALGEDAKSGAPIVNEWRLFWLDGALMASAPHSALAGDAPPLQVLEELRALAAPIASRFFAMDVAQLESGGWIIIELGDGGVSGLPPTLDARDFYARLRSP